MDAKEMSIKDFKLMSQIRIYSLMYENTMCILETFSHEGEEVLYKVNVYAKLTKAKQ